MFRAADTLETLTGVRPVGLRTPSWDFSAATLAIERELGLAYDSSLMADEDCYELLVDGEPTGIVELPVEWIRDDAPYFSMNRGSWQRPYTPPGGRSRHLAARVRRRLRRGRHLPAHLPPAHHRLSLADLDHRRTDPPRPRRAARVWFATHAEVAAWAKDNAA